eukprot:8242231-Pyramimonas_sp.AAC.1
MSDLLPAAPDHTLRRGGISKRKTHGDGAGAAPGAAPGSRGDRSRTPPPHEEVDLDAFATMAYVQTL